MNVQKNSRKRLMLFVVMTLLFTMALTIVAFADGGSGTKSLADLGKDADNIASSGMFLIDKGVRIGGVFLLGFTIFFGIKRFQDEQRAPKGWIALAIMLVVALLCMIWGVKWVVSLGQTLTGITNNKEGLGSDLLPSSAK